MIINGLRFHWSYGKRLMEEVGIWYCSNCNSANVKSLMWITRNMSEVQTPEELSPDDKKTNWCNSCHSFTTLVFVRDKSCINRDGTLKEEHDGTTTCHVCSDTDGFPELAQATVSLWVSDTFNKEKGRRKSLEALLAKFPLSSQLREARELKEFRAKVWEAYRTINGAQKWKSKKEIPKLEQNEIKPDATT